MSRRIRWYIVLIDLSLPSSNTGPIKICIFFFMACVILRIIFKFCFSQYACLCEQVGFLLRRSHILTIDSEPKAYVSVSSNSVLAKELVH